jgi:hypothetical protein
MTFVPGQSGNPKGARGKKTLALEAAAQQAAQRLRKGWLELTLMRMLFFVRSTWTTSGQSNCASRLHALRCESKNLRSLRPR